MPESAKARRWNDAVGVLPLEDVIALEHEFVHGGDTVSAVRRVSVAFSDGQIIDPVAFTNRLLRAWTTLEGAGARASHAIDTSVLVSEEEPLDAVAIFVLGAIDTNARPAVIAALAACAQARGRVDARMQSSDSVDHVPGRGDLAPSAVRDADARLVTLIVPHFNSLLAARLEEEPAFRPFLEQGAVAALGAIGPETERLANRLLLEAAFRGDVCRLQDLRLDVVYEAVRQSDTTALCLSGGGIRSATFANGVLRGLAKHGLLGRFDYLSTVSGGGYAGSWLSAWMHHAGAPEVHQQLATAGHDKLAPEPPPMQHLRAFSHFLTPKVGFFSTDTWTLATTIGRNMLFNWAVLLPLMAAALLVPRFVLAMVRVDYCDLPALTQPYARQLLWAMYGVGAVALTYGLRYLHRNRPDDDAFTMEAHGRRARAGMQSDFIGRCFVPLAVSAVLLTLQFYLWWSWIESPGARQCAEGVLPLSPLLFIDPITQSPSIAGTITLRPSLAYVLLALGGVSHLLGWAWSGRPRRHAREGVMVALSGAVAGLAALFLVTWFVTRPDTPGRDVIYTTLAPPALLGVLLVGSQLFTALTSRGASDAEREWVARFNAWLLIAIVMWVAACACVLYGPDWVREGWSQLTLLAVGGSSGVLGLLLARSGSKSSVVPPPGLMSVAKKLALALAAPVFAGSIIVGLAATNEMLIRRSCSLPGVSRMLDCRARITSSNDVMHSQPFTVRARHMTNDLLLMSEAFRSSGADSSLAAIFRSAAERARIDSATGLRSGAYWNSVVSALHHDVRVGVVGTGTADNVLRMVRARFTASALATDSAIAETVTGDPLERELLVRKRLEAVRHAGMLVRARRLSRDSSAMEMDSSLVRLASIESMMDTAGRGQRLDQLRQIRRLVDERLAASIELFQAIRRDSAVVSASRDSLLRVIRQADVRPYDGAVPFTIIILFAALVGLGLGLGSQIDTNKFSLRAMYEMRLVRAYLGASRPPAERRPNPFTGFDPRDDIPMGQLWPNWGRTEKKPRSHRSPSSPPFHVVNTTLNLVAGANLAWQQRKAESMTISPLHAGSAFVGYRATSPNAVPRDNGSEKEKLYGGPDGVTLGTAVTISGAAASPNSGSMSSPVATFLMTFFNARLGAWLGNPGRAGADTYFRPTPAQIVEPILAEMFGQTTDRSGYVALSDGGHFENLALYEMVLRRCRLIVVSDAGCDPSASFDDLGNAVRKIRIDLGIPIEFPEGVHIFSRTKQPETGGQYWAVGRIRYSAVDHSADAKHTDGVLIYLKPALYEREPSDVRQYARTSDTFPHESTADQFFSESQFESYRTLGEFIVTELVKGPLSSILDVESNNDDSLMRHWADLSTAVVPATNATIIKGSHKWPMSAEKHTG